MTPKNKADDLAVNWKKCQKPESSDIRHPTLHMLNIPEYSIEEMRAMLWPIERIGKISFPTH